MAFSCRSRECMRIILKSNKENIYSRVYLIAQNTDKKSIFSFFKFQGGFITNLINTHTMLIIKRRFPVIYMRQKKSN